MSALAIWLVLGQLAGGAAGDKTSVPAPGTATGSVPAPQTAAPAAPAAPGDASAAPAPPPPPPKKKTDEDKEAEEEAGARPAAGGVGVTRGRRRGQGQGIFLTMFDRSEARVRTADVRKGTAIDLETAPAVGLAFEGSRTNLTFAYGPRFSDIDITGLQQSTLLHAGHVGAAWWTKRTRLSLSVDGSIGSQSFVGLPLIPVLNGLPTGVTGNPVSPGGAAAASGGAPPAPSATPARPTYVVLSDDVLRTYSIGGSVGVTQAISHRWTGSASGFYNTSGGIDFPTQQVIPPSRTAGANVRAAYALTRHDGLATTGSGAFTWLLSGESDFGTGTLSEGWTHVFSPRTQSTVGAGLQFVSQRNAVGAPRGNSVNGTGDANLVYTEPLPNHANLKLTALASLGTIYNPLLVGNKVQTQLGGTLSAGIDKKPFSATLAVNGVTSLPTYAFDSTHVVSGSLTFGYLVSELLELQTGIRGFTQVLRGDPRYVPQYPPTWVAFLAVIIRAPVLAL